MPYAPYAIYDASQGHLLCNGLTEAEAQAYYDNAWRSGISAMQILDQDGNDVTNDFETYSKPEGFSYFEDELLY